MIDANTKLLIVTWLINVTRCYYVFSMHMLCEMSRHISSYGSIRHLTSMILFAHPVHCIYTDCEYWSSLGPMLGKEWLKFHFELETLVIGYFLKSLTPLVIVERAFKKHKTCLMVPAGDFLLSDL